MITRRNFLGAMGLATAGAPCYPGDAWDAPSHVPGRSYLDWNRMNSQMTNRRHSTATARSNTLFQASGNDCGSDLLCADHVGNPDTRRLLMQQILPPPVFMSDFVGDVWIFTDVRTGQFSELTVSWLAASVEIRVFQRLGRWGLRLPVVMKAIPIGDTIFACWFQQLEIR